MRSRLRKRPAETSSGYAGAREIFGMDLFKQLDIPLSIDDYNYSMNGVDNHDQLVKPYSVQRPQVYRTWLPLWYHIIKTMLCNIYKLSLYKDHWRFNNDVAVALIKRSEGSLKPHASQRGRTRTVLEEEVTQAYAEEHGDGPEKLTKRGYCKVCASMAIRRREDKKRKPLQELSQQSLRNTANIAGNIRVRRERPAQTVYGCNVCGIHLCKKGDCWKRHITVATAFAASVGRNA